MSQLHLQTKLISIRRIDCPQDLEYFGYTKTQIERGAKLFLEAKGIINPLIVKRTNNIYDGVAVDECFPNGRYEVRSGFLEYFCAVRAKEINPKQEVVQAIIADSNLVDNLVKQIELFRIGAETINTDDFELDEFADDFELVENEQIIAAQLAKFDNSDFELVDKALAGKSVESCFDAAQRLCNLYPDKEDRDDAIIELEALKEQASGSTNARARLDAFFAEAGGLYE